MATISGAGLRLLARQNLYHNFAFYLATVLVGVMGHLRVATMEIIYIVHGINVSSNQCKVCSYHETKKSYIKLIFPYCVIFVKSVFQKYCVIKSIISFYCSLP